MNAQDIDDALTAAFRLLEGFGALQADGEVYAPNEMIPYAYGRLSAISSSYPGFGSDSVRNWQGSYTVNVNCPQVLGK